MWVLGAFGFVLALLITVALHEMGHLIAAKKFGLAVPQYFVGFGKTLWSREYRGTEYGMKAIPAGGYVLIKDPGVDDPESEESMLLSHVSPWKRQIIFLAGPMVNLVLGTVMFLGIFMTMQVSLPTSVVQETTCSVSKICAAEEAGIQAGDKILALNGVPVGDDGIPADLMTKEMNNGRGTIDITVLRGDEEKVLPVVPTQQDGRWMIGIQMATETRSLTLGQSSRITAEMYSRTLEGIVKIPSNVPVLWSVIGGAERPDTAPVSVIGATKVSGDIAASQQMGNGDKGTSFLLLIASFNVGLGFLNLLPFLPLDGGRMLIAFMDSVKMRLAAIRKTEYTPTSPRFVMAMTAVFAFFLFGYMGMVMLADIVNPVTIG